MSITSISLGANQTTNYILVRDGQLTAAQMEEYLDIYFSDIAAPYTEETELFAKFNNTLDGGSYAAGGETIVGWDIYKQESGASNLQFVASLDVTQSKVTDYFVQNNQGYTYYAFPQGTASMGSPLVSNEATSFIWNWVLFTAEATSTNNVLSVTAAYMFQGNVSSGDMSNNAEISVLKNFTQYPKVIRGTSNYKSGTLSALIGKVDMSTNKYTEAAGLRDELYALATSTQRKFLKNRAGDIWEVDIEGAISMTVTDTSPLQENTISLKWCEVASTDGVSLITTEGGES